MIGVARGEDIQNSSSKKGHINVKNSSKMSEDLAIGIDLGTTNSCVALFSEGKLKVLENSDGNRVTPSIVYFTNMEGTLVGDHAKRMAVAQPEFGIYEIKRLVGRKFDDPSVQHSLQYYPFIVESDDKNEPQIVINHPNKTLRKTPQEVCTVILEKLKRDVEAKLGQPVRKAVVTVPAYFSMWQKEVTLAAAKAAGFSVLKLLPEPTAAALSYFFEKKTASTVNCLVYDLGGGTFDVAILKKHEDNIEVVCVDGDNHLGGHDFDNLIVDYVCEELKKSYDYDAKEDKENMRRLHNKCESAKKDLSTVEETVVVLNGFVKDNPSVQITVTREEFEQLADDLFRKTIDIVENCIKTSGLSKSEITDVILAGGSTRIPKIQQLLSECFPDKAISKFLNPDECVAEGAALQAAMLPESSSIKQVIKKMKVLEVVPLSLGVKLLANQMSFIIPRSTQIPVSKSATYHTVEDKQYSMDIEIFEGERSDVRKNRLLGDLTVLDITPAPPGQCSLTVTLAIDQNGILTIRAMEMHRNIEKELKVNYTKGAKSEKEVKNALKDYEDNKDEDERFKRFAAAKAYLIEYCITVKYNLVNLGLKLDYEEAYNLCECTRRKAEELEVEDEMEIAKMTVKVKDLCEPIAQEHNFDLMP